MCLSTGNAGAPCWKPYRRRPACPGRGAIDDGVVHLLCRFAASDTGGFVSSQPQRKAFACHRRRSRRILRACGADSPDHWSPQAPRVAPMDSADSCIKSSASGQARHDRKNTIGRRGRAVTGAGDKHMAAAAMLWTTSPNRYKALHPASR